MRRAVIVLAVALLVGAILTASGQAQYGKEYWKPTRVYSGCDSVYNAAQPDSATGTGALDANPIIYVTARGTAYSNWVDISELVVPPFIQAYMDTANVATTITRTQIVSGIWYKSGNYPAYRDTMIGSYWGTPGETGVWADSLTGHPIVTYADTTTKADTTTWTESWSELAGDQPIGFRLGLHASGTLDTVYVSAQVSMDKVGYKVIQRTMLDPSEGSTAAALGTGNGVTTTLGWMDIPAGKLKGWNYLRFQINNYDREHDDVVSFTAYHWYELYQPIPDWDEPR